MTIFSIWIVLLLIATLSAALVVRRKLVRVKMPLLIAFLILFAGGAIMTILETQRLERLMVATKWPTTEGKVLASCIEGERAFYPMITYRFTVGDSAIIDSTDFGVPGFGNKFVRLDVAEAVIGQYPEGTPVVVHYNPLNLRHSTLQPTPPWNVFVQLALGFTLSILGAIGIAVRFASRKA